jgi:hypothetical protein
MRIAHTHMPQKCRRKIRKIYYTRAGEEMKEEGQRMEEFLCGFTEIHQEYLLA